MISQEATTLLRLAWNEHPGLAVQLSTRFPSAKLKNDVRWLMLNFPEKAIDEPEGLELMFGTNLPTDVSSQLKASSTFGPCQFGKANVSSIYFTGLQSIQPKP